jgi:ketosteroid isomerase-like protein
VTDRLEIDRLLRELHGARVRGDLEGMLATFSDDVSFRIAGATDGKPIAIAATGIGKARPWLSMLVKSFRLTDYTLRSLLIDGAGAAAHWQVTIHSRITGTEVPTELIDLVEVRDHKITAFTEFFTPR